MSDTNNVRLTREGVWQTSMDGAVEARTSMGTSIRGNHYAVEVSYSGSDPGERAWSRPFSTTTEAARVASVVSERALGDAPAPAVVQPINQAQRDAARSQASPAQPALSGQTAQAEAMRERGPTL